MVVLADHDQRQPLHGGEVQALVKGAGRCPAVADVDEAHARLGAQLEAQRDTRHHRDHVAKVRDLAEVALLEVVEMHVQLAATRGTVRLGHVLAQDLDRLGAHHEQRPEVTDQRRQDVLVTAAFQGVGGGDGLALLPQGAKQPADDLGLAVQRHEPLFQRPRKAEVVVNLEELVSRQRRPGGKGCSRPSRGKSHGPKL